MRFPGQYYDAESGLHYNYYRTYDPESGRYITSDPLGVIGRSNYPQLVLFGFQDKGWFEFEGEIYYDNQFTAPKNTNHLYGYAGNNPLKNIDYYGLWFYGGGTGSLGDYISGPNGNVSPGFKPQDYVCSSVACVLNSFPPMVVRCIGHDKCYEKNRCNSSSFISSALGGTNHVTNVIVTFSDPKEEYCMNKIVFKFILLGLVILIVGCSESNFNLSPDSRLPKWFDVPEGMSRDKLNVTVDYYINSDGGEAVFKLYNGNMTRLKKVKGKTGLYPLQLKNPPSGSPEGYPMYEIVIVDGVKDIIEHRDRNNVFHMVDSPVVWEELLGVAKD